MKREEEIKQVAENYASQMCTLLGHLQSGSGAIDHNLHVIIGSISNLKEELK